MFELTEQSLLQLWSLNAFPVPLDRWVFFGLRGCLPVSDDDHTFAPSHRVKVETVDHVHPRCTIGQWQPGKGFALFPGSTVPHRVHVAASRPLNGAGTNQLMTGYFPDYRKGKHKAGSKTGHDAFRQDNKLPIHRSADDLDFDNDDRVEFDQPFDNLHCGWSQGVNHDSFASAGCQVVVGFPQCEKRGDSPDTGAWRLFKEHAYAIPQTSFPYVLLTGLDMQRLVHSATPLAPRIRYGSKGPLVTEVQEALKKRGFYEGEIDDDFGIRTLRAVLAFQTSEFGPNADDGIVGKQTAAALGITWPAAVAPTAPVAAPPAAVARPLEERPVRLEGDHAVAPDGTRFAKRFKKGVFTFGTTSIDDFVRMHRAEFAGLAPSLLNVMQAVSANEGKLEAVNTWDNAFMTFGVFQWTAGVEGARGELAALLERLKREHPQVFQDLFGRHGLDVANVTAPRPGVTLTGAISLDGDVLDTSAKKERLRTLDWAYRFWLAGHDHAVRKVQIKHAMDRLGVFYRSPKHTIAGRQIAEYVTSEVGVALLLDQHVNRPGHVPKTLEAAVEDVSTGQGSNPQTWGDDEERRLLEAYIDLRSETSMTDSDKRAQVVLDAATRKLISAERGSFRA